MATNFRGFQSKIRDELERAKNDERLNGYSDRQGPTVEDEAYPDAMSVMGGYFDPNPTTNRKVDK